MAFKTLKDWPADLTISQYLQVGDRVDNAMYERFLNDTLPHAFSHGYLQAGGVCDVLHGDDGKLHYTFLTFVKDKDSDCWIFKGECFSREWINRNPELEPPAEKFRKEILAKLESKGFDVSQIELSIEQFIDDEHKNCIWYGGTVATVEYKNHVFWLTANGDVSVTWLPQAGFDDDEYDYTNKNGSGAYNTGDALEHFVNDVHLAELDEAGRLAWQNNNWFEILVETPDGEMHDMMSVCNTDDMEKCILEMIENMDLTIDDLHKENSKIASVDNVISQAVQTCEESSTKAALKNSVEIEK